MTDDGGFLQAILAALSDDVPRLVYADWLEERGDPRAELLRLECQLMGLPPEAPSATRLRTRLRELCLAAEPDWVGLVRRQPVADAVEAALKQLESLLTGLNYVVDFGIYRVPRMPDATSERYISEALGPGAVVGGLQPVTRAELLGEVERCLRYPGTEGHGPDASTLRSPEFDRNVRVILDYLERSVAESSEVVTFWLREGHPFYPVMWDFAFVFLKAHCAVVFLGSSSD
jgi:uncharacterized protein (TIGR02996 family)